MKRFPLCLFAVLAGIAIATAGSAAAKDCATYGTSVEFVESPAEAARYANFEEKLVFVLHVSGVFEEADFT